MKKLIILFLICYTKTVVSQEIVIKDSLLEIAIENVNLVQHSLGKISNKNGLVNISQFNDSDLITISHLAYHSKKIKKIDIKNIILLSPKIKMLPTVTLNDNSKVPLSEKYTLFKIIPAESTLLNISSSDLLANNSSVLVQESQSGGGSPNYRGMEANRLLLVVDEISLNNTIYRSGHLQSSATINPFFIERVTLLSGPASVAYGNGAMGGALLFKTKNNRRNENGIQMHQQYESSSNMVFFGFLSKYTKGRGSHLSAFSIKSAGNLKMGANRQHKYNDWGKEEIIANGEEQLFTAHHQLDLLHKAYYQIDQKNQISFNTQYSTSSNINRFDKLNDYKENLPKYTNWYYGPQNRFLQSISLLSKKPNLFFEKIKTIVSYQNVRESRHKQLLDESLINNRNENVYIYDALADFQKTILRSKITYGIGHRRQNVYSSASLSNKNGDSFYNTTRYPDGGTLVQDYFLYSQMILAVSKKLDLVIGGRLNANYLTATYEDTSTYQLPFSTINNENQSFINSILLTYKTTNQTTINASYYNGFRNPNIDDLGKVFSKNSDYVVVPNADLEPEYSTNLELSIEYAIKKIQIQIQLFNTEIDNAISRQFASIGGVDSLKYDGEIMRIQTNKNISSANIKGINFNSNYYFTNLLYVSAHCNYIVGLTFDNRPLAHIPPLNAKIEVTYNPNKYSISFYSDYSASKKAIEYDDAGVDNFEEATIEGSPMWYTLNLAYKKIIDKNLTFSCGIKNIMDIHYKTFGSGISASGRNFIISLQANL
ncbi:MAG: hypothetical protein CMD16_03255 [Flavobacteriales bacterium]|nr:hypothetical protein [Flavobacteriales bacterium]|tara:strand:+ start:78101 stop:80410 length:2310 start_codon:yes stop_codon:yes gene_type:complete